MELRERGRNKRFIKGLVLFIFLIIFIIMIAIIQMNVDSRKALYDKTSFDLGKTWGGEQVVTGPILVVPYLEESYDETTDVDSKGKEHIRRVKISDYKHAIFLPKSINSKINLDDEVRHRGIYKVTVYNADMRMSGEFDKMDVKRFFDRYPKGKVSIDFLHAYVSMGFTDTSTISQIKTFFIGGTEMKSDLTTGTGIETLDIFKKSISSPRFILSDYSYIQVPQGKNSSLPIPFDINMNFRGSNKLTILPLGEANEVRMTSSWPNPSFEGMPTQSYSIDKKGFEALWNVSKLNKNYPVSFADKDENLPDLTQASFGVKLFDGVSQYRLITRAVKYGFLFFALSFLVLFLFDVTSKRWAIHYVQYAVVGFSLVMFYLLLLALSEHLPFVAAYLISTVAVVIPISLYTIAFMKNKKIGIGIFFILLVFYMLLLCILNIEDYALITGTVIVMIMVYVVMFLTRNMRGEEKNSIEENGNHDK